MIRFEYPKPKRRAQRAVNGKARVISPKKGAAAKGDITPYAGDITRTRGRKGNPFIGLRLSPGLIAAIDHWAAGQPDKPIRTEAIRRILEDRFKIA